MAWSMKAVAKNARHIGELGIGLNPAARMYGNLMEDEKLHHTVHLATGMDYEGLASEFIHQDCRSKTRPCGSTANRR